MSNKIEYNGRSGKMKFYKLKKHAEIIKRRLSFSKQKTEIERINNPLLNIVLKSIEAIKNGKYDDVDRKAFEEIDAYRAELLHNSNEISYEIFNSTATKQIKDICSVSASPKVWGQFLYFISKYSKSKKFLEIGTNVGISGAYILNAMKQNSDHFKFVSMEGLEQLCVHCDAEFSKIVSKDNFDIISGLYDDTFPKLIAEEKSFDVLFIDGNHQKDPTIEYYEKLKKCSTDKAIFIFDDIYYNTDMTEAWDTIVKDVSVNFSIDMFKLGIVIVDKSEAIKNKAFGIHLSYD